MGLNRPNVTGGGGGTITQVSGGSAISGGGSTGSVSVALDVSELSDGTVATADKVLLLDSDGSTQVLESVDDMAGALPALTTEAAIDVSADYILFLDGGATGTAKKESIVDLATALAGGTGLSASSGQLSVDSITATGALDSGSITSGFGAIDVGSSAITTTGNLNAGDATLTGGDLTFGNGQNANVTVGAVSGTDAAGKSLTVKAGQGTGAGAGGDIIFQTANAGSSGSSANPLATALTLSDDLSGSFGGHVSIPEGSAYKIGSTAILNDAGGTCTLSNIDLIDATTEATIENAIDTLSNLTSVGTITTGTWNATAIGQAYIAADAINGDKIADDSIDSEHYVDGSIDTAHIGDNQVTLAKMAGLARGNIIVGDSNGDPSALGTGSQNQVLTVDANGDAVWAAASGGGGMSNFILEDGAGTEVIVSDGKEVKFIEGGGIDITWSDTDNGTDADPYDLTFTVNATGTATAMVTGGALTGADAAQQIIAQQVFS
tara:strand:- start:450 stop:1928 length:1479 start_codon:yes stop_codon:yes gene_type:complete